MDKGSPMFRSRSSSLASRKFSRKEEPEEPWDYVSFKKVPSTVNSDSKETVQFTFDENNMPLKSENHTNGSHHNINYEVAKKQELEVIYEYVEPRNNKNRTMCIIVAVILVILCIGGGVGVALWQIGMFSSDIVPDSQDSSVNSQQNEVKIIDDPIKEIEKEIITERTAILPNVTTTRKALVTTNLHQVEQFVTESDLQATVKLTTTESTPIPRTTQPVVLRTEPMTTSSTTTATTIAVEERSYPTLALPTTPFEQFTTQETLIVTQKKKQKDDNMLMLLTGGISNLKNDQEIGEIIGKRRKGRDEGCQKLESWSPHFTKFIGTAFLPAIDAIVSCGYTHVFKRYDDKPEPMTSCYIYYKYWSEWQHVNVIDKVGFYEGAYFSWQNRLVLFGGNAVYGESTHTITRSITVFEFSKVKDLYGYHSDSEDYYGSGDSYGYDDSDDSFEGSTDGDDEIKIKVTVVENSDNLLEEYGPGAIEGCAVSLIEKENSVSFIVTGGKNVGPNGNDGTTMRKTLKAHLRLDQSESPALGREHEFLPMMNFARKQHGCAKIFINGQDTLIVAGGSGQHDILIPEVEFLGLRRITTWKIFGNLNIPRFGFPSIGKVLGQIVVVGGKNYTASQSDKLDIDSADENVAKTIEVYDEKIHNFRSAIISDNLGKTSLEITRYNYHGVLFPKSWCHL
eukprot:GFUD01011727.1.p1 GENE.GFUD01011727.1~~GFUD01011727.1.p1  ORF type:complete len:681 (+),score=117.32 GFUD01011727.1:354-2396(+)